MVGLGINRLIVNAYKPFAGCLLALSSIVNSHAASYIINPTNTNIRFSLERFKTAASTGGFYNVKGKLQYDPSSQSGNISLMIPIGSLETGNQTLNKNLKGADFFDMQYFPSARFQSTNWYFNKNAVTKVDGNLTLNGKTHPISLTATTFNCYVNSIINKQVCSGEFATTIDRTKWNINKYSLFGLTKHLDLKIQIEAMKQ